MSPRPARAAVRRAALRLAGPAVNALGRLAAGRPPGGSGRAGEPPRRLLLVRPDHLGDALLATPVAGLLRAALPGAEIDWLVGPWSAEVVRRAGGAGTVRTVAFPGFTRSPKRSPVEPYRLLLDEAARLRDRRYDAALVLRPDHWWGAMLIAAAGVPRRFGFAVAECRPFLTDLLPLPGGDGRHAVRMNQALARLAATRLGGAVASASLVDPSFSPTEDEIGWARAWLAAPRGGGLASAGEPGRSADDAAGGRPGGRRPLVVVHPGSGAVLKNWPPARWAEMVRLLRARAGVEVVLTGGPTEGALVGSVAAGLDPAPRALVGSTTLGQLAALFAEAALVVGGDSGPLHLAAAVGTRTVRIYGPTDVAEFGPWPPDPARHAALAAGLACQPCRALVDPPCGAGSDPPCLAAVSAESVAAAALRLLGADRSAGDVAALGPPAPAAATG